MAKKKSGRPEKVNAYNIGIGVVINGPIRRALKHYKTSESAAARMLIVAGLLRDKLITKDDLPPTSEKGKR